MLHETLDLFLTREAAEAELREILEDEPDWRDVLRVVPIELRRPERVGERSPASHFLDELRTRSALRHDQVVVVFANDVFDIQQFVAREHDELILVDLPEVQRSESNLLDARVVSALTGEIQLLQCGTVQFPAKLQDSVVDRTKQPLILRDA